MSRTIHVRHLRHRQLLERGLFRGPDARVRLRSYDAWAARQYAALPAEGGLAGSATPVAVTGQNATNDFDATSHPFNTGDLVSLIGTTAPTPLTLALESAGTLTSTGQPSNGDVVLIGVRSYAFQTADLSASHRDQVGVVKIGATQAATMANLAAAIQGDDTGNVRASGAQVITGLPSDGDTITVGASVYTFRDDPNPDNVGQVASDVAIKTTNADQLAELARAINGAGAYTGHGLVGAAITATDTLTLSGLDAGPAGNLTVSESATNFTEANTTSGVETHTEISEAHPEISAADTATTVDVTARAPGAGGDAIPTTEVSGTMSWGSTTLTGGTGATHFAIRIDANTLQLADSIDDALAGTNVTFSDNGTAISLVRELTLDQVVAMQRERGIRSHQFESASDLDTLL